MNDLLYFLIAPITVALLILLYKMRIREWNTLTTEEIFAIWDANADRFGNVEEFARALERKLEERNT